MITVFKVTPFIIPPKPSPIAVGGGFAFIRFVYHRIEL